MYEYEVACNENTPIPSITQVLHTKYRTSTSTSAVPEWMYTVVFHHWRQYRLLSLSWAKQTTKTDNDYSYQIVFYSISSEEQNIINTALNYSFAEHNLLNPFHRLTYGKKQITLLWLPCTRGQVWIITTKYTIIGAWKFQWQSLMIIQ